MAVNRARPADPYVGLLDGRLSAVVATAPAFVDAPPGRVSVERGVAWPLLVADPGSGAAFDLLAPLLAPDFELGSAAVVDGAGHARPTYPPLLGYAAFQAVAASNRVLLDDRAAAAAKWADDLAARAVEAADLIARSGATTPARLGGHAAAAAWAALALHRGGELLHDDRAIALGRRLLLGIVDRQQAAGPYLVAAGTDGPDVWWFHELQVAHAVGSYALQTGDGRALASARRAAAYHMAETQPDHATNQPWGLTAFLCDEGTRVMADGQLHAATSNDPGRADGATLILLADALYSVRRGRGG